MKNQNPTPNIVDSNEKSISNFKNDEVSGEEIIGGNKTILVIPDFGDLKSDNNQVILEEPNDGNSTFAADGSVNITDNRNIELF